MYGICMLLLHPQFVLLKMVRVCVLCTLLCCCAPVALLLLSWFIICQLCLAFERSILPCAVVNFFKDVSNQQMQRIPSIDLFKSDLNVSGEKLTHPQEHFLTICATFGTMHRYCCRPTVALTCPVTLVQLLFPDRPTVLEN